MIIIFQLSQYNNWLLFTLIHIIHNNHAGEMQQPKGKERDFK